MQTKIVLNGISHALPDSTSSDGDMLYLINLRKKDQSFHPVTEGKEYATLKDTYDIVYIHSNNKINNWIAVKEKQLYTDILNSPKLVCELSATITHIEHIGNTLILSTGEGFYYLLYKNGYYKQLGFKPPFPQATIQCIVSNSITDFTAIEGSVTDVQTAMEAMIIKNRWKEDSAYLLCGAYLLRYALRMYDGSYMLHSSPYFIFPCFPLHPYKSILAYDNNTFIKESSTANAELFYLSCEMEIYNLSDWNDIITDIDFFISEELGVITEKFKKIEDSIINITPPEKPNPYTRKSIRPQDIDKTAIIKNIDNVTNFYLIKSLSLKSNNLKVIFPEKIDIATLQNLVHQPTLPVDSFSHHNLSAAYTYTYNQRLHIANIQTHFFRGFKLQNFVVNKKTLGRRPGSSERPEDDKTLIKIQKAFIQIYINIDSSFNSYVLSQSEDIEYYYINPFFSYPDSRASKAVITFTDKNDMILKRRTLSLKPHPNLNLAYYMDSSLEDITILTETTFKFTYAIILLHVSEENKIKVSALQNPFIFLNENTYIVNGKVIGMATNAIPVSEGQFGQFPLYVFTKLGIYIFGIGSGSIVYSNIVPVAEEIALPGTIKNVAGAVFFLTSRGAFLITGSTPVAISSQLNTTKPFMQIPHFQDIKKRLFPKLIFDSLSYLDFIQRPDITIHYNYQENELLIISRSVPYAYVYNLNTQVWYMNTHIFLPVYNSFPYLFGIVNNKILNISDETNSSVSVLILLRPLKLNTQRFKNLQRYLFRSYLNVASEVGLFTLSSTDASNFVLKSSQRIKAGKYRDIDTGLLTANKYRYFSLLFGGELNSDSRIDYIETTWYNTYLNDKIK